MVRSRSIGRLALTSTKRRRRSYRAAPIEAFPDCDRRRGAPRRSGIRAEHGQALVELALVVPFLMLVVLGIFKFGVAYNNYLVLTDAVRTGARQLAIERGQATPCPDATNAITNAAPDLGGVTVTFAFPGGQDECNNGLVAGDAGTVTATYPSCDAEILGINFAPGCTLTASTTERIE